MYAALNNATKQLMIPQRIDYPMFSEKDEVVAIGVVQVTNVYLWNLEMPLVELKEPLTLLALG